MGTLYTGNGPDRRHDSPAGGRARGVPIPAASSSLPQGQAGVFDAAAEAYDDAYPHKSGQIIATQWLVDRLGAGARVLDLGCGTGVPTSGILAETCHRVVGIDVSAGMLDRARRTVPAGTFLQRDMRGLDDSLGAFDAAAVFHSLSMLPRADIPGVLAWLVAVLRPGSPVAIGMADGDLDHSPRQLLDQQVRLTAYPLAELVATVNAAGLDVIGVDSEEYEPAADMPAERHNYLYCETPRGPARPRGGAVGQVDAGGGIGRRGSPRGPRRRGLR